VFYRDNAVRHVMQKMQTAYNCRQNAVSSRVRVDQRYDLWTSSLFSI